MINWEIEKHGHSTSGEEEQGNCSWEGPTANGSGGC